MYPDEVKNLFQMQSEIIDMKIDRSANRAIDRVVEQIISLRNEVRDLRNEMNTRMTVVETKLNIINENQKQIRSKFIDYVFEGIFNASALFLTLAIIGFIHLWVHH